MTTPQPAALPELPELPEPAHRGPTGTGAYFNSYTADQMRAYALAALQPNPAEVSDADVWALWLRVCNESENLSTRVMIANFARAILALRPQVVPTLTNEQIAAERDRLSQGGDWFAGAVWARSMISSAATQAVPMTDAWLDDAMRLADAYADASFDQGLNQRTEDPNPEAKREKLAEHLRGITAQAKEGGA